MTTPHVCLVNCLHPPDDVRVVQKLGRAMRDAGMQVSWVGPRPERGDARDEYGIRFYFFEPGRGRVGRLLRNHRAAFDLANRLDRADAYIGVEPDSASTAAKLAKVKRSRAVFDVHEAYDDEMLDRWAPKRGRGAFAFVVRRELNKLCDRCDLVIGVNDAVLSPYAKSRTRRLVVRSCAPAAFAGDSGAIVCGRADRFTVMQGKATLSHGTAVVVCAFGIAARKIPGLRGVFFEAFDAHPDGFTRERFEALVDEAGARDAVEVRGRIHMTEMPAVLRTCDAGLISYDRTWGVKSLPNKLFEYMAMAMPVVAPSYAREIRPIVERERCGLLVDCERPEEIADALVHLQSNPSEAREMGRRGREAFLGRYNFDHEVAPLLDSIREWSVLDRSQVV